jgi:predicted transcriptional regulator
VIEDSLKDRLKALADGQNRKMSDYIRLILLDFADWEEERLATEAAVEEDE